jgi:hypothetical protein
MVDAWDQDSTKPNPYAEPVNCSVSVSLPAHFFILPMLLATTKRDIRPQLLKDEEAEASRGILPPHEISPSSFLHTGFELEEQQ